MHFRNNQILSFESREKQIVTLTIDKEYEKLKCTKMSEY